MNADACRKRGSFFADLRLSAFICGSTDGVGPIAFGDPNAMIGRSMRTEGSIDKAVILARGLGTRMRKPDATATLDSRQAAIAESGVKAMIPVGAGVRGGTDRPFLDYVL